MANFDFFKKKKEENEQQKSPNSWANTSAQKQNTSINNSTALNRAAANAQADYEATVRDRQRYQERMNTSAVAKNFMAQSDAAYVRGDFSPREYMAGYNTLKSYLQKNGTDQNKDSYNAILSRLTEQRNALMPGMSQAENLRNNRHKPAMFEDRGMVTSLPNGKVNPAAYQQLQDLAKSRVTQFQPKGRAQGIFAPLIDAKPQRENEIRNRAFYTGIGGSLDNMSRGDLLRMQAQFDYYNKNTPKSFNSSYAPDQKRAQSIANGPGKDTAVNYSGNVNLSEYLQPNEITNFLNLPDEQSRRQYLIDAGYADAVIDQVMSAGVQQNQSPFATSNTSAQDYTSRQRSPLLSDNLFSNALEQLQTEWNNREFQQRYANTYLNEDFDQNNQYIQRFTQPVPSYADDNARNNLTQDDKDNLFYESVNGNQEAYDFLHYRANGNGDKMEYGNINDKYSSGAERFMRKSEVEMFNYLWETQGKDAAMQYYDGLTPQLNKKLSAAISEEYAEWTRNEPFMANLMSVVTKPFTAAASAISQGLDLATGPGIDANNSKYAYYNYGNQVRSTTTEMLREMLGGEGFGADAVDMLYNAGMSALDNVYGVALGGAVTKALGITGDVANKVNEAVTLGIMSTDAAQNATLENIKSGMNTTDAVMTGLASGGIEFLTEKIGLDNLFNSVWQGKGAWVSWAKQMLAEGGEELVGDAMNDAFGLMYDQLVGHDVSDWRREMNAYILENGLAPSDTDEAFSHVFTEHMKNYGKDFALGAISAAGLGSYGTAMEAYGQHATNVNARNLADLTILTNPSMDLTDTNVVNAIIQEGKSFDPSSAAFKKASRLESLQATGSGIWNRVSEAEARDLYQTIVQAEANGELRQPSLDDLITNRLMHPDVQAIEPAQQTTSDRNAGEFVRNQETGTYEFQSEHNDAVNSLQNRLQADKDARRVNDAITEAISNGMDPAKAQSVIKNYVQNSTLISQEMYDNLRQGTLEEITRIQQRNAAREGNRQTAFPGLTARQTAPTQTAFRGNIALPAEQTPRQTAFRGSLDQRQQDIATVNEIANNYTQSGYSNIGNVFRSMYDPSIPVNQYFNEMGSVYNAAMQGQEAIPQTAFISPAMRQAAINAADMDRMQTSFRNAGIEFNQDAQYRPQTAFNNIDEELEAETGNTNPGQTGGSRTAFTPGEYAPVSKTEAQVNADIEQIYDYASKASDQGALNYADAVAQNYADDMDATQFQAGAAAIYQQAKNGVALENVMLPKNSQVYIGSDIKEAIYNAAIEDIEEGATYEESGNVFVPGSSERNDRPGAAVQSERLESGTGQTAFAGRNITENAGSESTNGYHLTGQTATAKSLGINDGTTQNTVQLVELDDTPDNRKIQALVKKYNKKVVAFAGNNLSLAEDGEARAAIKGDTIYLRVDHPTFSPYTLVRHEVMHAELAANKAKKISTIMNQLRKTFGNRFINDTLIPAYQEALPGMSLDDVKEEIVCDIYGEMNIWKMDDLPGMKDAYNGFLSEAAKIVYQTVNEINATAEAVDEVRNNGPPATENSNQKLSSETDTDGNRHNGDNIEISVFNPNKVKYVDNHNPTENPDIRFSTEADSDAFNQRYMELAQNQGTNEEELQQMVDDAAEAAGWKPVHVYHGTLAHGFTVFDRTKAQVGGNSGAGFYFSTDQNDSDAHYADIEGADNHFKAESLAEVIMDAGEWNGIEVEDYDHAMEIAKEELNKTPGVYDVYLKYDNPYIRDFRNSTNIYDQIMDDFDESLVDRDDYENEDDYYDDLYNARAEHLYESIDQAVYNAYRDLEDMYEVIDVPVLEDIVSSIVEHSVDYESITWDDIYNAIEEAESGEVLLTRDDWSREGMGTAEFTRAIIEELGFDSVVDKEVTKKFGQLSRETATDTEHIIVFKPNQIKSSDPVVYDNDGNIIPIEQRFNTYNDDIRYSREVSPTAEDKLYLQTIKKGDMTTAQRLVDEAAAEAGYTIKAFHGTANGGKFTIFDPKKLNNSKLSSHIGQGFYFTNSKSAAEEYTKNYDGTSGRVTAGTDPHLFEGYIKLQNPIEISTYSHNLSYNDIREIISRGNKEWFFNSGIAHELQNKGINGKSYSKAEILKMDRDQKIDLYAQYMSMYGDQAALSNMVDAYAFDSQDKLLEAMQDVTGHDGIHWEMRQGLDQFVVFNSSQFKEADAITYDDAGNVIPLSMRFNPDNPDIRYSRETSSDASLDKTMDGVATDLEKRVRQLEKENRKLTREYEFSKAQAELTAHTPESAAWREHKSVISERDARKMAKNLIEVYDGTIKADEIVADLQYWGTYLLTNRGGRQTYSNVNRALLPIAKKLIESAQAVVESDGTDIMRDIKATTIKVSPRVAADIGDYNEWRKKHFGRMNISTAKGIDVTEYYQMLHEQWGSAFPEEINTATDQLLYIADFVDNYVPETQNPYSFDMAGATQAAALDIFNSLLEAPTSEPTQADIQTGEVISRIQEKAENRYQAAQRRSDKKIERLRNENKARMDALRERARTSKNRQIQQIKDHYKEVAENRRARKEDSDARKKLLKIAQRLDRMKTTKANKALIKDLIGDLDLVAVRLTSGKADNLQALSAWYESEKENNPDFVTRHDLIGKQLARLSQKHIADMTLDDVRELTDALKVLETTIRTEKQLIGVDDARDTLQMGMQIIRDIDNSPGTKKGLWRNIDTLMVQGTLSPTRFMHRLTGYVESDPLYQAVAGEQGLAGGQRRMLDYQKKAGDLFKEWLTNKKLMKFLTGTKAQLLEYDVLTADGQQKRIQMTPAMRMTLYLASKDQGWMEHMCGRDTPNGHIAGGGITLPDMKAYMKGNISDAYGSNTTKVKVTKSFLNKLAADMTTQERAFADAIHDYFNGMSKDYLNEVSEQLLGCPIAKVGDYLPISVDKNFLGAEYGAIKFDGTIEGMGNLKERQGSKKPVIVRDITDILKQSIESTSKYVGLAIPIRNINKLMGVTLGHFDSNGVYQNFEGSVLESITNKWGDKAKGYVEKMISDLQTPNNNQEDLEKTFAKVRSKYAGAVLTLNLSVAMKQAASYPTAAGVLGWRPLVQAFRDNGHVDLDLIAKYTPLQWYRTKGFSTQELGDIQNQNNFFANLPKGLNWIQGVDLLTTRKLWKASEFYVRNNNPGLYKKGAGIHGQSDAYYRAVADIYNQVIEETQPNYTSLQRPEYLRSKSGVVQTLMMFKTQPMQNFNVLYDAIGNFKGKKAQLQNNADSVEAQAQYAEAKKKLSRAITSQIGQLVTFAAMTMLWNLFRRKKEKYTDKNGNFSFDVMAQNMGKDIGSGIFGMLPFGSDVWSLISSLAFGDTYYGFESVTDSALGDMGSAIKTAWDAASDILTSGEPFDFTKYKKKLKTVASAVSKMFGIPFDNIYNTITAMYKRGRDVFDDPYDADLYALAWDLDPAANQKAFAEVGYRAYQNGDKEKYNEICNTLVDEFGFDPEKLSKSMKDLYAVQYATDPKNVTYSESYQHLLELSRTNNEEYLEEYQKMIDMGFTDKAINDGIEGILKVEQGVDKVTDLEERFTTPAELQEAEEALKPIRSTSVYKNASPADKQKLEEYAQTYENSKAAGWTKGKEAVESGALTYDEYMKFRLALDKVDQPTESGKYGSYTKDEQIAAINEVGWSDDQAAKLWDYLPSTASNPYLSGKPQEIFGKPVVEEETTPSWRKEAQEKKTSGKDWIKSMTHPEEEKKQERQTGTVQSSWLSGYDWDPETGTLQIQANGRWYTHHVTQEMFDAFMAAPSKGSYYSRVIKYY